MLSLLLVVIYSSIFLSEGLVKMLVKTSNIFVKYKGSRESKIRLHTGTQIGVWKGLLKYKKYNQKIVRDVFLINLPRLYSLKRC
jgi:hypothetical protein